MMAELHHLLFPPDTNDIKILPRRICSAANIWADNFSRVLGKNEWQLNPRVLKTLQSSWGPHTIGRFA
jgi:hypothetical protein